jgi:hypothetical protein
MRTIPNLRAALVGATLVAAACGDAASVTPTTAPNDPAMTSAQADQDARRSKLRPQIIKATGDITAAVNEYRTLLGALNANVPGEQTGGRREVNWDGVPPQFTNNDLFPGNFFNVNSPRGILLATNGFGFRISDSGYVDLNPKYVGEFNAFSPFKLFIARGSTTIDVRFVVAGSNTPAVVTGFGSVFEDVGRAQSTTIEYFDVDGNRLAKVAAPRRSDAKGLSFVGVKFDAGIVARVRITAGDTPLSPFVTDNVTGKGRKRDLVATDDFIYGEPRAITH